MSKLVPQLARSLLTPPEVTVCAIGDIHGRLDLLKAATEELRRISSAAAADGKAFVGVFLGDYIDRGPNSCGVISHLIALRRERPGEFRFLRGNHEQILLDLIDGVEETVRWLDFGGVETLQSYGLERPRKDAAASRERLAGQLLEAMPEAHIAFLRETELYAKYGDYLFVHAGLRPDRLLEEQSAADMLWFRYYADERPVHGEAVVHGHSPNSRPIEGRWRIGIDTEAYASGALTILKLQGDRREFLKVCNVDDSLTPRVSRWESTNSSYETRSQPPSERPRNAKSKPMAAKPSARRGGLLWLGLSVCVIALLAIIAAGGANLRNALTQHGRSDRISQIHPQIRAQQLLATDEATPGAPAGAAGALREIGLDASAPMPVPAAPLVPSGGRVQVGAFASADQARQMGRDMARKFPTEMNAKSIEVDQATRNGALLYRAFVGGFATLDDARRFCKTVRAANQDCLVRPTARPDAAN